MGEYLYQKWASELEKRESSVADLLARRGYEGVLEAFECWLERNSMLRPEGQP